MYTKDDLLKQLQRQHKLDPHVVKAMSNVPRELFIPSRYQKYAYADTALPLSQGQTISQPTIVALMTQLLNLSPEMKVLEIGTGSGYQCAVLAEIVAQVYTIERHRRLSQGAKRLLDSLGYTNIDYLIGDGSQGWPQKAPFDAIMVTAAADHIPKALTQQLHPKRGRLLIPVGEHTYFQVLTLVTRNDDHYDIQKHDAVRFVPLISDHK